MNKVTSIKILIFATFVFLFSGAYAQEFGITIDGQKDAWYEQLTGPSDGFLSIPAAAYNTNGQPDNNADCSAFLWTAWDSTYLYIYEEVKDNVVHLNNATSYNNDILEMYFDPNPAAVVTSGQMGVVLTALDSLDADTTALAGVQDLKGNGGVTTDATKADYARTRTADGYTLEARIKWDWLKDATRTLTPAVGTVFGMATMNHDNDVAAREGSISWATVLNDNVWNTPANHGTVEFLADHKLKLTAASARDTTLVNALAPVYVPNDLPADWLTMDIGAVSAAGSASFADGKFMVTGSGADIWGNKDEFRFVFQTYKGDIEITANLEALTQSDPWTKGALMIRDALNDSSAHAIIAIASANGEAFQWRPVAGEISIHTAGVTTVVPPKWIKLVRLGNVFSGYTSTDGEGWDFIGRATITMTDQIYVGMAVTSHLDGSLSTATYSGVEINTAPVTPKLNFNIAIDAVKDPWYKSLVGPDNGYVYLPAAVYNNNGQPDNNADLSASLWTGWDDTYLYIYEEVKDNKVLLNNATSYNNDILEMYFDPNPKAAVTTGQLGVVLTALDSIDADGAALAGVQDLKGNGGVVTDAKKGDYARAKITGGYALEARLKWAWLKDATRTFTPGVGTIIGMATMNHDNDLDKREGTISWATVLNDNVWNTPKNHGTVEFLADHQLKLTAKSSRDTTLVNALAPLYIPNNLPADWLTMNIGNVGLPGDVSVSGTDWTVVGSGGEIGGSRDAFRFAFQTKTGDCELTSNLTKLTKSDNWTQAGLMIRDALDDSSAYAIMAIASGYGQNFQYRPGAGGESYAVSGDSKAKIPQWIKVVRFGDVFSGWTSTDGKKWQKVAQAEIMMTGQVYIGMAVTSHKNTATSTAIFSNPVFKNKPTAVEEKKDQVVTAYELCNNYPNPFNPKTTIQFSLPKNEQVKLTVYDILGREVMTLIDGKMNAGVYTVPFDASRFASGMYFYKLHTPGFTQTKKMMLVK
jgi:hypothetical protein